MTFETAQMIDISDDAFAGLADDRRDQRHAARRHIHDLTGKFTPVGQHVAAQQVDADALKAPTLFAERPQCRSFGRGNAMTAYEASARKPRRAVLTAR